MTFPPLAHRIAEIALAVGVLALCSGSAVSTVSESSTPQPAATSSADREGAQFYAGSIIDVSNDVDGDVYAAGQSVTISGDITGDVIAAALTVTITGTVDGDVRIAAQDVTISGTVSRSGTIAASTIDITDTGSVGNDVVGAAQTIGIAGTVGRNALLSVDRLTIDGTVGGDLTYSSETEATMSSGAVSGSVERIEPADTRDAPAVEVSPVALVLGWLLGLLFALVALSLVTLAAGLLAPRLLERVTDRLVPSPWKALLVGFVASLIVPGVLFFLLLTLVGAPLALAGILLWMLVTLATFVYGAYYLGRLVFRDRQHPAVMALVGGAILITALQIPWVNVLVWLAMVFFGVGAQLLEAYGRRPWTRTVEPAGPSVPEAPAPVAPAATGDRGGDPAPRGGTGSGSDLGPAL